MWLHVPSLSAPGPGCSTSDSTLPPNEQALTQFAQSCTLNGKHTRPATWLRKWKQEPWMRLLSGLTLEPSQAQSAALTWVKQVWTPSLAESPASRSPSQGSGSTPMTPATSSVRPWNSLKPLLLNGSPWKTSQGSLFQMDSADSQKDWTNWATTWRQSCSALVTWARTTAGQECLSWQTPTGSMIGSRRQVGAVVRENLLPNEAQEWRTPSAGDPEGGVMEIRPDTAGKYKLRDDSVNWATPQAFYSKDVTRKTPTTVAGCRTLANDLADFSLPQRTTPPHGSEPCMNDLTSALRYRALRLIRGMMKHRLNPLFAEWLMGWPEQWSNANTDSGSLVTEWCLYKQQLHTAFSLMLSEGNGE